MTGCVLLGMLAAVPPAPHAAFPGENGKLAFSRNGSAGYDVYTVSPGGTGETNLTGSQTGDLQSPSWSPDGSKIAYSRLVPGPEGAIWVMNADGSGKVEVAPNTAQDGIAQYPAWSPDGTKIAYTRWNCIPFCATRLYTINADGTGDQALSVEADRPVWSPDGQLIAFNHCIDPESCVETEVHTVRPDGSDQRRLSPVGIFDFTPDWAPSGGRLIVSSFDQFTEETGLLTMNRDGSNRLAINGTENAFFPAWSPDGNRVAAFDNRGQGIGIYVMDTDGTDASFVAPGTEPDWQPNPVNAYPRPKGASPTRASLVPAYEPCTSPDRTHGPPLAFGSCSSPTQTSNQLTVGSPDANERPAKSVSYLRVNPLRGDPLTPADEADVRLRAIINDVRVASDLSDYTGDLEARLTIQITDKDNTPHPGGPGAATVQGFTHPQPIPCTATENTTVGATCEFDTTVEALVPGAVKEQLRAIWELGAIRVHDGAGNLFLTQGVFVP